MEGIELHQNSYIGALTPRVTACEGRAFKEVIKVK